MTLKHLLLSTMLLLVIAAPALAQPQEQPATPVLLDDKSAAERAKVDESISFFLLEALTARSRLREQGLNSKADRFWGSASDMLTVVRNADPEDAPLFLPILDGFRRTLADTVPAVADIDQQSLAGLQEALDDQIRLHTSAGAFPDAKGMIAVEVRALRDGQAVNNLYVSLDLVGAVPNGPSANTLANVTSPAQGAVGPGRYLVRLRSPSGEVGRRDVRIGTTGAKEKIDVLVNP